MTPEQLGAYVAAVLLGAGGVLGRERIRKLRKSAPNDTQEPEQSEHEATAANFVTRREWDQHLRDNRPELERLIGVEKRVEALERRVASVEEHAEHRYQLLLEAITALGDRIADQIREMAGRLDGRIDDVYRGPDRRSRT